MKEDPSGNKKPKEPAPTTTGTNKCRLIGHNHLWKNCPNNPASKNYNEAHYSKVREQEKRAGTTAPGKTDDKSTNSDDE